MKPAGLLKILFAEDLPSDADLAVLELRKEGLKFEHLIVDTEDDFKRALVQFEPDIVISDYMMPSFTGLQALKLAKDNDMLLPFILYTGSINEEIAVDCIKKGATDYVIKEHMTRLPFAVREALAQTKILREKKDAELQLKNNEEKIQSIFRAAPVGIGLVLNRVFLEVNDTLCKITGFTRDELIGNSSRMIYDSNEEYERIGVEKYRQIAETGTGSIETKIKTKDGRLVDVILSSSPLDKFDLSKGVTFTILDITDKVIRETELRKLTLAVEQSPTSILITDPNGIIEYVNPKLCELTGFAMNELIGSNPSIMSSGEKSREEYKVFWETIKGGNEWRGEFHNKKKNGELYWESASVSPIKNEKNEITSFIGIKEDISERIKAADAILMAKEKAEASDKLKTTFLNNISHEVRTPLNGILGFGELISQDGLTAEERAESLEMLHESNERLLNTINNYVDIALIVSGTMKVNSKYFEPDIVLNEIFEKYKPLCSVKKIELSLKTPVTDAVKINSDQEILLKVMSHLMNNALKFTESGSIEFGYIIDKEVLQFFVSDSGKGINKESVGIIFDHFVKEESDTLNNIEGSGLGLSIAKGMIDLLSGEIWVNSETGKGSTFFFTIPLPLESDDDSAMFTKYVSKRPNSLPVILIAEDDEANFYYINALLKHDYPSIVIHAVNGIDAVQKFIENPDIDIVLMDLKMPVLNGYEATSRIKSINKDIPVIAITAYAMTGDDIKAYTAGCNCYISKPVNKSILIDKIKEFLKK